MLCLSILLILIAIFHYISSQASIAGIWAFMWYLFWHDIQACIAVILACLTAFRTLFLSTSPSKDSPRDSPQRGLLRGLTRRRYRAWRRSRSPVDIEEHHGRIEIQRRESVVIHEEQLLPSVPHLDRFSSMRSVLWENGIATRGGFEPGDKPPLGYAHTMRRGDSQEVLMKQSSHNNRSERTGTEMDPEKGRSSYETFVQLVK